MRPELIIAVGLPGSGKSTYLTSTTFNDYVRVSPDDIRKEIFGVEFKRDFEGFVWFAAKTMVRMLLVQEKSVIIDATSLTKYRRKEWIDLARECGKVHISAHFFDTSFEECVQRNKARERVVPQEAMEHMRDELEAPTPEEGFDSLTRL